jgi:excinuclease UvrABC nuclease subunit
LISEKQQLPHLVVIDGGVGQLNVARRIFEKLDLLGKIDLISISKDKGHRVLRLIHTLDGSQSSITDSLAVYTPWRSTGRSPQVWNQIPP